MAMADKYKIINIRRYIGNDNPELGEDELLQILSEFSCPMNPDVEPKYLSLNVAPTHLLTNTKIFTTIVKILLTVYLMNVIINLTIFVKKSLAKKGGETLSASYSLDWTLQLLFCSLY